MIRRKPIDKQCNVVENETSVENVATNVRG